MQQQQRSRVANRAELSRAEQIRAEQQASPCVFVVPFLRALLWVGAVTGDRDDR